MSYYTEGSPEEVLLEFTRDFVQAEHSLSDAQIVTALCKVLSYYAERAERASEKAERVQPEPAP